MAKNTRNMMLGVMLLVAPVFACGGGEEATPTPRSAPRATATTGAPPPATVAPQATSTPLPQTSTDRPQATVTPLVLSTPTATSGQSKGKLVVALGSFGTEARDPITSSSASMPLIGGPMFDWAIWHAKDGTLAPGVFERWEQASDGMSWTFTIRDMRFHNQQSITAEDVKFDFERVLTPEATGVQSPVWKATLRSVEVPSPRTAIARLKQPWPLMPHYLSVTGGGSQGVIYSKSAFEPGGTRTFLANPIGSGPFTFVDHQVRIKFSFKASGQKHPYRPQPDYETLEFVLVPEESTRVAMLRTSAADIISVIPDSIAALRKGGFGLLQVPDVNAVALRLWGLDNGEALKALPTGDARVREALELAINRQEIVSTLLADMATIPPRDFVFPGGEGFDPKWQAAPFDPLRAKELLARAGYSRGFNVRLYNAALPAAPWTARAGEAIAGHWADIGVRTELIPIEYGGWQTLFSERPHTRALGAYGWLFTPNTVNSLKSLTAALESTGSQHLIADPAVDALLQKALVTTDPSERAQVIRKMSDVAHDLRASIVIAFAPELYAASPKIMGWDPMLGISAGIAWETVKHK